MYLVSTQRITHYTHSSSKRIYLLISIRARSESVIFVVLWRQEKRTLPHAHAHFQSLTLASTQHLWRLMMLIYIELKRMERSKKKPRRRKSTQIINFMEQTLTCVLFVFLFVPFFIRFIWGAKRSFIRLNCGYRINVDAIARRFYLIFEREQKEKQTKEIIWEKKKVKAEIGAEKSERKKVNVISLCLWLWV